MSRLRSRAGGTGGLDHSNRSAGSAVRPTPLTTIAHSTIHTIDNETGSPPIEYETGHSINGVNQHGSDFASITTVTSASPSRLAAAWTRIWTSAVMFFGIFLPALYVGMLHTV